MATLEIEWMMEDSSIESLHKVNIDIDELADCEDEKEVREMIEEYAHQDFMKCVSWSVDNCQIDKAIAQWKREKAKQQKEEDS